MAARKKKAAELEAQTDPTAPLDGARLLDTARPLLKALESSLLERAVASAALAEVLEVRHRDEREARRTADPFEVWRRSFVEQVAAAWFLSCVFVRTLEDRGLLERRRLAGAGALDSQKSFFELAPSLSERDYLLTVFRELASFPAARELFDARHNPVWLLGPSAEACRELLQLFRTPGAEAPAFRFGSSDTRFLGDLYQDLNENVRARYALLQTPRFVESFILDRTLEPALERFGLDDTTLIDPTCGSGHFLLGAFDRLYEHRLGKEPGLDARVAAKKALDAVFGADINPYAVAIARFRLTLSFLEKGGFKKLKSAPAIHTNLAVADSLLYNPGKPTLARVAGQRAAVWHGPLQALDDDETARAVLGRPHAAVVGNPPYITVKDAALRDLYREGYQRSAAGKYSLAAPFTECFFELARKQGRVGMITANSFMKREFGRRLIEEYLPAVNLDLVVNTSGAYIPGHGTPTVLLFGSAESPQGSELPIVLASRGEPATPEDPERGLVWSSIAEHWDEPGFENDFITVARFNRDALKKHPWSLGGGGATELKELLEERAERTLGDLAESIGISAVTGEDEVYLLPFDAAKRLRVGRTSPLVTGEFIRDWTLESAGECVFPYDDEFAVIKQDLRSPELTYLWPFRTNLGKRRRFGTPMLERGLTWYELQELYSNKLRTPLTIAFAFVATHNHFVLDRGGKVFKQSAPIIKLPETATEEDHLALLAYLNSSTACFYLRQVLHSKGAQGVNEGHKAEEWEQFLEFSGTQVASVPLPENWQTLAHFGSTLSELAAQRQVLDPRSEATPREDRRLLNEMAQLQEQLDFEVYRLFGLLEKTPSVAPTEPGHRPFEIELARSGEKTAWFSRHGYTLPTPEELAAPPRDLPDQVKLIEQPLYKRRWLLTDWSQRKLEAERNGALAQCEQGFRSAETQPRRRVLAHAGEGQGSAKGALDDEAIPFLAAYRHTEAGLEKRAAWERTWELQRREDAGEAVGEIPVPPKYDQKDFRDANFFRLRGKLDVPKERFISYPGCESDEDGEPVYGWAGWNHLERAQALAALYQDRKTREGWKKERLLPMLAGLLELLPWIKQWHNEPSAEFDGLRLGDYFENFLRGECAEHGFTEQSLRDFRPESGRKSKPRKKASKLDAGE